MTMENTASQKVEQVTIEAVVIRANGTIEDLGVVDGWHRNPLKRLRMRRDINRRAKGREQ